MRHLFAFSVEVNIFQKVYLLEKMLEPSCIAVSEESAPKRVRVNKAGCGMFVYCLQCHTSRAKAVAARCEQIAGCRAIYPLRIRHVRKQNRIIDLPVSITPGYLYLFMEKEPLPINQVLRIQGVKNILGEKLDGYQLSGAEKDFALKYPKKHTGNDGTEIGLHGGTYAWNKIPLIPRITSYELDTSNAANGTIKVSIKAEAQTKE